MTQKIRMNWWAIGAVWGASAILILSLAAYRHKVESANGAGDLSSTILFCFLTAGPALVCECLFYLLRPVAPIWKEYVLTRRRLKHLQTEHAQATGYVAFIDHCRELYENEELRLRSLYDEIWHATKGGRGNSSGPNNTTGSGPQGPTVFPAAVRPNGHDHTYPS
jgi:hypothetical protein